MSSTSMDISERFRAEDLSKTDFFDFVSAPEMAIGGDQRTPSNSGSSHNPNPSVNTNPNSSQTGPESNGNVDHQQQPLQGYDQFWGAEKDTNQRLESAVFEDLNRFCWNQQGGNVAGVGNSFGNTDGQIYTLTVLNGTEQWLKKEIAEPSALPLDLDTLLGGFPGYIKSEYSYEDSGFGTEKQEEMMMGTHPHQPQASHHQQQQQQSPLSAVTSNHSSTNLSSFHNSSETGTNNNNNNNNPINNNNNDWQMTDHNHPSSDQSSAESLLRSALQGKGYTKGSGGMQLQNGITIIQSPNSIIKGGDELRRAIFVGDQDTIGYADSTLSAPLFDDPSGDPHQNTSLVTTSNLSHPNSGPGNGNGVEDDMFLNLDHTFPEDFEKIKRIANEVQQFYTNDVNNNQQNFTSLLNIDTNNNNSISSSNKMANNNMILNLNCVSPKGNKLILNQQPSQYLTSPTMGQVSTPTTPTTAISSSTITTTNKPKKYKRMPSNSSNNNNNNSSCSNLNLVNSNSGLSSNNSTSPCNGQRKERSLHYCSICSKGFKDKYSVNVHIRTHTGEKPFSCSLCGKSFRQKAHLAKHYQTHLAQKNNNNNSSSNNNLKSSKQQQNLQQQSHQIIASTSAIIPLSQPGPQPQSQPMMGLGSEVALVANP